MMSNYKHYRITLSDGRWYDVIANNIVEAIDPTYFMQIKDGAETIHHVTDLEGDFVQTGYGDDVVSAEQIGMFQAFSILKACRSPEVADSAAALSSLSKFYEDVYGRELRVLKTLCQEQSVVVERMHRRFSNEETTRKS